MTRIVNLFLISLIVSPFLCKSQAFNYELLLGEKQEVPKNIVATKVLGRNSNGYIVLTETMDGVTGSAKDGWYLYQYNFKLEISLQKHLNLKYKDISLDVIDVVSLSENELTIFATCFDKTVKKQYLFAQKIDTETFKLKNTLRKLCEIGLPREHFHFVEMGSQIDIDAYEGRYVVEFSRDSSMFLVYHSARRRGKQPKAFQMWTFDNELQLLKKQFSEIPYRKKLADLKDLKIANNGTIYMLMKIYHKSKREKRRRKANFKHHLFCYNGNDSAKKTEVVLSDNRRHFSSLKLYVKPNSDVICTGFYLIKKMAEGSVFYEIDGKSYNIKQKKHDLFGPKLRNRGKEKLERLKLKNIYRTQNGELILVGEETYITDEKIPGKTTFDSLPLFAHEDMLFLKLDPYGTTEWATLLPKRQLAPEYNNLLLSYAIAELDNHLFVIYNTSPPKSKKRKYYKRLYNGEDKAVTLILEVNPDGKFSQQFLFSEQEHKTAILPNTLLQFRPSLFFFVGATVGNQTFGRIELKRGSDLR